LNAAACSTASAPGSIIVIGAGPIGLAALLTSQFSRQQRSLWSIFDENRRETSSHFAATTSHTQRDSKAVECIVEINRQSCVDTAIEAVGGPASFIT
jgi:alcohol dehydrogenase